jgi:hypothetical protein
MILSAKPNTALFPTAHEHGPKCRENQILHYGPQRTKLAADAHLVFLSVIFRAVAHSA